MKNEKLVKRTNLEKYENQVTEFIAEFKSFGKTTFSSIFPKKTLLLTNLRAKKGEVVADHIWIRADEVRNLQSFILKKNLKIYLKGIPYAYYSERNSKISQKKISIGNISILKVI